MYGYLSLLSCVYGYPGVTIHRSLFQRGKDVSNYHSIIQRYCEPPSTLSKAFCSISLQYFVSHADINLCHAYETCISGQSVQSSHTILSIMRCRRPFMVSFSTCSSNS